MKKAKTHDFWRGLYKSSRINHLRSIDSAYVPGLPLETVNISGPLTIITGLNGVGKSTILHSIRLLAAQADQSEIEFTSLRNAEGIIEGKFIKDGIHSTIQLELNQGTCVKTPSSFDFDTVWIDPAFQIPSLVTLFRDEQNLEEALDQVEAIDFDKEQVAEISWLVGKDYETVTLYELDDFNNGETVPYFKACSYGKVYGTECMGLGEAAIFSTYWAMIRAKENSLILLEEPETYISSRSQEALIDKLVNLCVTKKCTAVVTTHSQYIFSKVPPEHTLILVRNGEGTRAVVQDTERGRLTMLSVPRERRIEGYLLVEDRCAREFGKAWLTMVCPDLLNCWRIVDVGSDGDVISKTRGFPIIDKPSFRLIGLLDGDMKSSKSAPANEFCFLPTSVPPEVFLRNAVLDNIPKTASTLGIDPETLSIALASVEGIDHHDWLSEIEKLLLAMPQEITYRDFIRASTQVWLAGEAGTKASEEALAGINRLVYSK